MKIMPVRQNFCIPFKSQTAYYDNKIVEQDALTLEKDKSYYSNPVSPNQNFIGFNLIRNDNKTIYIKSRYNHVIGTIKHNPAKTLPEMNITGGSHQPVIELVDDELGIKILLNRGSNLSGSDLNISYDKLNEKKIFVDKKGSISFGNNIFIANGYKADDTKNLITDYYKNKKNFEVEKSRYANRIKNNYSLFGLAAGYGTRLKPISDLNGTNKPCTTYPSTGKSLLEISCLDTAARAGNIQYYTIQTEDENNLSGTAGPIIKALKNGSLPLDKPLVLLTSDTFNNIDLAKVLYDFEHSKNTGIGVVVKDVSKENLFDVPLVSINSDNSIEEFHEKINSENYREIIDGKNKFYTSTNIMVIHPKILQILKKFADENGNADFLDFLNLMQNTMNKRTEDLGAKYPYGLGKKELKIEDLIGSFGYPKNIYADNSYYPLKVNAIYAQDIKGDTPYSNDIGTIEDFIQTVRTIKNSQKINGISSDFINKIKGNVSSDGIIFMQPAAKQKLEKFKQKYHIKNLEGNVIVSSIPSKNSEQNIQKIPSELSKLAKENPSKFIEKIMENQQDLKQISQELIEDFGLDNFLNWYLSNEGYYGAYEKYLDKFYNNAKSIDELLKFSPNWSPWKLEEKFWRLENTFYERYYTKSYADMKFKEAQDKEREQAFTIGTLPNLYFDKKTFDKIVQKIREENIKDSVINIDGYSYNIKRLKGGELNDKLIYKIRHYGKDFILKTDRSYAEDNNAVWLYDKKVIKKNKVLMADSNFTNACISRYLDLNGCKNIPKLIYYDYKNDAALYEYVEDARGDLFQQGKLDEEYSDLNLSNDAVKNLREKGIYLNDTALKNFFTEKDGTKKIIDLGHANFIMPFKPGVKHYNIEFANINGPDFRTIYASFL